MIKSLGSRRTSRLGQGIVELALVLPVILALSTAAFDIARVRQHQSSLTRAAQAGVNLGTKLGKDFEPPSDEDIRAQVKASLLPPLRACDVEDSDIIIERMEVAGQRSVSVRIQNSVEPLFFNWPAFANGDESATSSYPVVGDAVLPMQEFTAGSPAEALEPAWTIEDDGTLVTTWDANSQIVGSDYGTQDGTIMASYAWWQKKNAEGELSESEWEEFNNGDRVSRESTSHDPLAVDYLITADSDDPAHIVFKANAPSAQVHDIESTNADNCLLFRDGDPAPMTEGAYSQGSAAEFLAAYIDAATNTINIGENDVIVLWDFNYSTNDNLDWNDLVMVVTMVPDENED